MVTLKKNVKREGVLLLGLLLVVGCTQEKPDIGLEVPFHDRGCSGFDESFSEVEVIGNGLRVSSYILSDHPCYRLYKAEISRKEDDVTVYFTFEEDTGGFCEECVGVQTLAYAITGSGLNKTGVNVEVISYLGKTEVSHSFTS